MASDLREIVSALKISSDLERMGDYAKNVAKRAIALNQLPPVKPAGSIPRMARLVQGIIKDMLDAYIERDAERAVDAWRRDEEVDELYTSHLPRAPHLHDGGPAQHHALHASAVHRQEPRADRRPRHQHRRDRPLSRASAQQIDRARPKGDTTSFTVVTPDDAKPAGRGRRMSQPTILVVEDEAPLVTLLRYNLEREGFAVLEAQDGDEA